MAIDYNLLKLTPPEPTVKVMTAQDYLSGSQAIRDARRKKAIEFAMRSGIDAKGELNTEAMRQSLISQGFGENADQVVREVSMARLGDVSTTFDVGTKLKAGVDAGIISPEVAQRAMGTTQTISKTPLQTRIDSSWMDGVPGQPITQSSEPSDSQTVRITGSTETMQPLYEYERTESKAQAVPEYSANLIDFAKKQNEESIGDIQTTGSGLKYTLPEGADKQYIIAAAKTLGYTGSSSEAIDSELTQRAMAQVAQPVLTPKGYGTKELLEARAEYAQKLAEYPALIAQKKAELIKQLEAGQATRFGQGVTSDAEERAKESQRFALAGQKDQNIFAREVSPAEAQVVKLQRAAISDIVAATPDFAGAYQAAVAKAKSDGSVNQDAIISNLVAMGAMPSQDAIQLKALMATDGSLTAAASRWIINKGLGQRGPSSEWKQNAIGNINQYIVDNGGKIVGSAKGSLEAKGVGAKKSDKPASASQSSPKVGDTKTFPNGRKAKWDGKGWVAL